MDKEDVTRRPLGLLLAIAVIAWGGGAAAKKPKKGSATGAADAPAAGAPTSEVVPLAEASVAASGDRTPDVRFGGRIFVRALVERPDDGEVDRVPGAPAETIGELEVASARLEAEYRWKKRLRAVLEFELRGRVRDAYVRVRATDEVQVRAGQFKQPFSVVELESAWTLPVARRGLLSDVFEDSLEITGRLPGAQVEFASDCPLVPRVRGGAWHRARRNASDDPVRTSLVDDELGLAVGGRAALRLGPVEIAAAAQSRAVQRNLNDVFQRFWAVGLDATLERGGWRAWAEVAAGSRRADPAEREPIFVAGRAIVAWRSGGLRRGDAYVEPFAMVAALDPNTSFGDDVLWEVVLGANVGFWDRWRLQAQLERRERPDGLPTSVLPISGGNFWSRTVGLVQLGVAF